MTQADALTLLKMGRNVFLTGPAGSGKTYLLNQYLRYLRAQDVEIGITASTGIAATHLSGTTIHSWCGIGIREIITEKELKDLLKKPYLRAKFKKVKALLIDEISMLDGRRLNLINMVCRSFLKNPLPFGGLQVILCGDLFQLPPVTRGMEEPDMIHLSPAWEELALTICYLEEQHRQADPELLNILNEMRANAVSTASRQLLHSRINAQLPAGSAPTKLYTHNIDVEAINSAHLDKIPEVIEVFSAKTVSGNEVLVDILKKSCLAPQMLAVKKGALVMFVKNNFEQGYVNGTMGTVVDFDDHHYPVVRTHTGQTITAEPAEWSIEEQGEVKAAISQIPLRLAWAITVHKSQGMSLDAAEIDLSKSFTPGMGYVALSRARTLAGITLKGLNDMALRVDENILTFDAELRDASEEAVSELIDMSPKEIAEHEKIALKRLRKSAEEFTLF